MRGKGRTGVLGGNFMLGRFFRLGKVRPGFFFPRGKIYTGILFPGAILSRGGFSGGKFNAGGNSMLQHRAGGILVSQTNLVLNCKIQHFQHKTYRQNIKIDFQVKHKHKYTYTYPYMCAEFN